MHAARFIPQHDVLAAAAAVVCHAGVGTVYGALSAWVPLVVAPLAADQRIAGEIATAPPPSTIRPWLASLAGDG